MKDDITHRSMIVWVLIILQFLLGLGAVLSGGN
jgi:heme A synthase